MRQIKPLIAALFLISPFAASADPIVTTELCADGVDTCYASIQNLNVDGIFYSVDWYSTRAFLSDLLTSDPEVTTFAGDSVLALAAANAINQAFNDAGLNLFTTFDGISGFRALYILSDFTETEYSAYVAFSSQDIVNPVTYSISESAAPFAIFARTSVPEPGTLALLGIGLAGMGLSRRRRKI